jgi:hypothetical protein
LWDYWPGFSSLRAWGRMNIILLPIFAWLLFYAYQFFEDSIERRAKNKKSNVIAVSILVYAVIFVVQHYLYTNKLYDFYWVNYFNYLAGYENKFIITGAASFAFILFFLIKKTPKNFVAAAMVLICTAEMFYVGTHTWTYKGQIDAKRTHPDIAKIDMASFSCPRVYEYDTIQLNEKFNTGIVRNWYYQRYTNFITKAGNEPQALSVLLGLIDGRKIFFSKSIDYSSISLFLEDALSCKPSINVLSYDGDELTVEVQTLVAGYLSFIDNWDSNWKAAVDNKPDKIELLFGTFKSVAILQGSHIVKFYYKPKLFSLISKK